MNAPTMLSYRARSRRVKGLLKIQNTELRKRLRETQAELTQVKRERDEAVSALRQSREAAA